MGRKEASEEELLAAVEARGYEPGAHRTEDTTRAKTQILYKEDDQRPGWGFEVL